MPFYPPDDRRRGFTQGPRRGAVPPENRQNYGPPRERRRPENPYMYNQQQAQGYPQQGPQGYPQPGPQGYAQQGGLQGYPQQAARRRPDINRMMDHAGKISEGINIVRQIGALFNFYR